MFSPDAEIIETGAELIKTVPAWLAESQLKELEAFGSERAKLLGASGVTTDFQKGYELGLAVARAVIKMKGGEQFL